MNKDGKENEKMKIMKKKKKNKKKKEFKVNLDLKKNHFLLIESYGKSYKVVSMMYQAGWPNREVGTSVPGRVKPMTYKTDIVAS